MGNQKRNEELQLEEIMKTHVGLKDAYEKFQIMRALVLKDDDNKKGF